jgi:beta-lactamase class A
MDTFARGPADDASLRGRSPASRPVPPRVQAEFEALVLALEAGLKGVLGFCARHLESGDTIGVKADQRFPMASTCKVAIAGALLARVDGGEVSLDQMVSISLRDCDETGEIAQSIPHPGVSLSVANLLELMLTQSNNNATDRILAMAGGPAAVTGWLRKVGIVDMQVDRTVNELLNKFYGFPPSSASTKTFRERWKTAEEREQADGLPNREFDESPQDTTTPAAMVQLLALLYDSPLLGDERRHLLSQIMCRCETGPDRIKGRLPPATVVAHKTGTVGGTVNDVGLIHLPRDRGRIAIAIYTKKSPLLPYTLRERSLAEVSRSVYDFFVFR